MPAMAERVHSIMGPARPSAAGTGPTERLRRSLAPPRPSIEPHDCLHEARFAASANSGGRTDCAAIVAEAANPLELVLPPKQTHAGPSLSTGTGIANITFIGVSLSRTKVLTPITAEFLFPLDTMRSLPSSSFYLFYIHPNTATCCGILRQVAGTALEQMAKLK